MRFSSRDLSLLGAIALLFLLPLFGVSGFYSVGNLRNLIIDNLPILVAAIGMTIVIIAAQIDISIGSQFVVCGIFSGLFAKAGVPMPWVVLLTLGCGSFLGFLNGVLVTVLKIPAIITTLATLAILRNAVIRVTGGDWIQDLPTQFQWFGLGQTTAQPLYIAIAAVLFIFALWALRQTSVGRRFYAIGCDHEAARRVGLNPNRVVMLAFVLMGIFTAAAALLNFTRYPTIETNAGQGLELKVIAAVVVGGTAITGGRGSLIGTLLGTILLGTIGTVFTFLHVNPAWEKAIQGAIILVAVVSDTAWKKETARG
ncbi:MAG TPA: ABC transporter permease [Opitutaceae bacterium]|nr:ABC transporter permease [Opitutaceae bacterium]